MKILFVTNHKEIAKINGGYISDYLNDLVFYGLYEILGSDVIDSTAIISLYKNNQHLIDPSILWGGFSTFWLIEQDLADRNNIEDKIKDKFYDFIIYGAIKRCTDYYQLVESIYPANKIIIIDGADEQDISTQYDKHPYFKRELHKDIKGIHPISFSIPASKIAKNTKEIIKDKAFGTVIPGVENSYIFKDERSYYKDYQRSFYGLTMKKDGWDCMRHYEILGNYCIPYFINLDKCPEFTMVNFPKKIISSSMNLFNSGNFSEHSYFDLLDELFDYTALQLTSKKTASELLEKIC